MYLCEAFINDVKKIGGLVARLFDYTGREERKVNFEFTEEDLDSYLSQPASRVFYDNHLDRDWKKRELEKRISQKVNDICDVIEGFVSNPHVVDALSRINEAEERTRTIRELYIGGSRNMLEMIIFPRIVPILRNSVLFEGVRWFTRIVADVAPFVADKFPKIVKDIVYEKKPTPMDDTIKLYDKLAKKYNKNNPEANVETSEFMVEKLREEFLEVYEISGSRDRRALEMEFDRIVNTIFGTRQANINARVSEMDAKVELLREEMKNRIESLEKIAADSVERISALEDKNRLLEEENRELKQQSGEKDGIIKKLEQQSAGKDGQFEERLKKLEELLLNSGRLTSLANSTGDLDREVLATIETPLTTSLNI
jgi:hypothetical protein